MNTAVSADSFFVGIGAQKAATSWLADYLDGHPQVGFSPIKDCLKTRVYQLSRYRNTVSLAIPEGVIERAPSAELAPDQLDQDSLPEYAVLDEVLHLFVDLDWSIHDIVAKGYEEAMVRRVAGMVLRNEYKRRQGAPGTRVTSRGFGRDRRYPITSGWTESFKST